MSKSILKKLNTPIKNEGFELPKGYKPSHMGDKHHSMSSVREVMYKGREIKIETTYKITIDGKPLMSHVGVLNNGRVHSHDFPQYSFNSAVGMVKKIIKTFHDVKLPKNELSEDKSY